MASKASREEATLVDLFFDLVRVETRMYNAVNERLREELDLGAGRYEILKVIGDRSDLRVADVAETFAMGVGAVSKIVDRLEGAGLVERRPNPANRRSSLLSLTAEGRLVVTRARPLFVAGVREELGRSLTGEDLEVTARVLGKVRRDLESRSIGLPVG